jgi:outer membrane protein assembly factor BamB
LAFDGATGAPLWESVTDPTGSGANDYAWGVAADSGRVHVVGEIGDDSGLLIQSHDAATGTIQWQQHVLDAHNFTLKDTIAAGGNAVFIGGSDGQSRVFVRSYDAETGALQWEDRVEGTGQLSALSATGNRLFAVGVVGCDPATFFACELAVRAYDAQGGLVWQRSDVATGGDWYATNLDAAGGQVIVGGNELLADGDYHPTVRSYEWSNGSFEWGAYFDDATGHPVFGFTGFVNAILVRSDGVFVGGAVHQADGGDDWLVRKYRRH